MVTVKGFTNGASRGNSLLLTLVVPLTDYARNVSTVTQTFTVKNTGRSVQCFRVYSWKCRKYSSCWNHFAMLPANFRIYCDSDHLVYSKQVVLPV